MNLPEDTTPEEPAGEHVQFRSPELLARTESTLLVIDVQDKVLASVPEKGRIVWNIDRMIRASQLLEVPVSACEQYPDRLGTTVSPLREKLANALPKRMFSCRERTDLTIDWSKSGLRQIVIVGIETHVCILQTALDLLAEGFMVYVVIDAIGSRAQLDHDTAVRRMETAGATLTTTESVLFEWCETSLAEEFKQISQLILEKQPAT